MARSWTASQEAAMRERGKTLLVSAAAGSGKTSVLTERIIRSLTDPESPADLSRLLVVTFTRAAAAELKARIATALTEAMAERPSDTHLSEQLMKLGSADICTIDSFFQKLVRTNFEQLGIAATFRIADKSELLPIEGELMEGLLEEFYVAYATDPEQPLRNNRFAEAIDNLMSNRSDGRLISTLLEFYETFASYPEGIDLIRMSADELRNSMEKPYYDSRYGSIVKKRITVFSKTWIEVLKGCDNELAADPDSYQKCCSLLSTDIDFCKELSESQTYTRAAGVLNSFITGRFPTVRNKSVSVARYQNLRVAFRREITKLQALVATPEPIIWEQMRKTADFCEMLFLLFRAYKERLNDEKSARGILEHNDVRAFVYELLTCQDGSPSAFSHSLSALYDAVYIDEYQDVDLLQDRIFALLGGSRRFMVGDIKQSIYGFRGSDPSIFADYRRRMPLYDDPKAKKADGVCIFMSENFRCDRPVINFANRVCGFLFSACEESVGYRPQDDLVCSKIGGDTHVPVQVAVFDRIASNDDDDKESLGDEANWVADEIVRLLRGEHKDDASPITPSDIAILVRTRAQGKVFAEALSARGVAVSAEAAKNLWNEPLTVDVLNLLRTIDNPYQDIPLTELLLSSLYGFTPSELSEIRASAPRHKALVDAMTVCSGKDSPLSLRCGNILSELERLRESAISMPADRFLRLLYLDPRLSPHAAEPALLYLYDRARLYQRSSWCGLYGFLEHIEKMQAGEPTLAAGFAKAEAAVSIMTVHHSKGLEFPVVFLGACGAHFNRSDSYTSLMFHQAAGCAVKLYDPSLCTSNTTALRDALALCIDEERSAESVRTLYVALTRARERLYVTGTLGGKWENALAAAETVTRGAVTSILSCNSYLAQIMAALTEGATNTDDCILTHIPHSDRLVVSDNTSIQETIRQELPPPSPRALQYAKLIQTQKDLPYDLSVLNGMPTKAAASKLRPDLLDRLFDGVDETENAMRRLELMRSSDQSFAGLLTAHRTPTAAEIGTATHSFLQFCDFAKLTETGIDAECARLTEHGFLTSETVAILRREQLEKVITSNMMKYIKAAKKVRRELRFAVFMPLRELTAKPALSSALGDHTLLVQGSIDLLLEMPDGALYLFDYKTDSVDAEAFVSPEKILAKMRAVHGDQLAVYARAIHKMFGKAPDKIFLYSLPLGMAFET